MSSIFTFQIEDQLDNSLQLKKSNPNEEHVDPKQEVFPENTNPFTFQDFEEEAVQQTDQPKPLPLKGLSLNKEHKITYKGAKTYTEENHDFFKKKLPNEIVPGLEVENLEMHNMEYLQDRKALKVTDLRKFLYSPLGNYKIKAILRKEESSIFNFNAKFSVYIEQNNRYLFSISRQGMSEYIFSMEKNHVSEKRKSYLGKMTANMTGTEFLLYDGGFSPKQTRSLESCRKQFASIKYVSGSGPRKFSTVISTNSQGFYALEHDRNILEQKWEKKEREYLSILYSKSPELDPEDGNYKLDFKGLVKKASVKNFILGGIEWEDSLIFGKIDDNGFVMEIKEPLSVFQAAGICISSIHYKLNWQ